MKNISVHNSGTALVTALVLLVALTIVSLSGMQATSMQIQISGNDEAAVEAYQYAQSVVDAVIEDNGNFVVGASDGYTLCASSEAGCDSVSITLGNSMFSGLGLQAKVELLKLSGAPRLSSNASSAAAFDGAYFKISGRYDETSNNRGKANVVQGYLMIIPKT